MASALARALALVDMSKASKQDVELLKKLVVEFKDELDALGVRVDSIDQRFSVMERRLGGWAISGQLRQDFSYTGGEGVSLGNDIQGFGPLARARMFIERRFGVDDKMHFWTRIDGINDPFYRGNISGADRAMRFTRYQVTVPFWDDAFLRVGRQGFEDLEAPYYLDIGTPFGKFMSAGNDTVLYDRHTSAIRLDKNFGPFGGVTFAVGHETWNYGTALQNFVADSDAGVIDGADATGLGEMGAWMLILNSRAQFTEKWGFDIGINYYLFDDTGRDIGLPSGDMFTLKNVWTAYGGLRFDFTPAIALKGIYLHQAHNADMWDSAGFRYNWDWENAANYKIIFDAKQELLKFSNIWLEYNYVDRGFWVPVGPQYMFHDGDYMATTAVGNVYRNGILQYDMNLWRVAAQQAWNDKLTTYLFYENGRFADVDTNSAGDWINGRFNHFGVGIVYQYNPTIGFGLMYQGVAYAGAWEDYANESMVRFRTHIAF